MVLLYEKFVNFAIAEKFFVNIHRMKKITVLVPAYNEAKSLPALYAALSRLAAGEIPDGDVCRRYDWEFLIVDDGSSDATAQVAEALHAADPRVNYLILSRNFGKENAMLAGMDYAQGDAVVIMDADLQHPVETVPEMIRQWEAGYDDVYGRRLSRGKESFVRRKFSEAYYALLQKSTDIPVLPNVGDFRLLDRKCIDALTSLRETQRNTKGLYCWVGFRKTGVDFDTRPSDREKSSFSPMRLVNLAIDGITGYTTAPLRMATILGMMVSAVAFIYLIVILAKTIFWGEVVRGFPTIMCTLLLLGGVQLLSLGVIGEYVGRIFNESKCRPPYIVRNYSGGKKNIRAND